MLIVAVMLSVSCSMAYVYADSDIIEQDTVYEIVYIEDDDGNLLPVEVIEETELLSTDIGGISINANPEQPVGSSKTYTIKVSNEAMGLPSLAGQALSFAARTKAAKAVSKVLTKKLGANFIPGLNVVTFIAACAAMVNARCGNNGISVTVSLKYIKKYMHKEGHYVYGWDIKSVKVKPY